MEVSQKTVKIFQRDKTKLLQTYLQVCISKDRKSHYIISPQYSRCYLQGSLPLCVRGWSQPPTGSGLGTVWCSLGVWDRAGFRPLLLRVILDLDLSAWECTHQTKKESIKMEENVWHFPSWLFSLYLLQYKGPSDLALINQKSWEHLWADGECALGYETDNYLTGRKCLVSLKALWPNYCYICGQATSSHTPEEALRHLEKYWPVCPHRGHQQCHGRALVWLSQGIFVCQGHISACQWTGRLVREDKSWCAVLALLSEGRNSSCSYL